MDLQVAGGGSAPHPTRVENVPRRSADGALRLSADPLGRFVPYAGVVLRTTAHSLLSEPRPTDVPPRSKWDWVLVATLMVVALLEAIVRLEPTWLPVALLVSVAPMASVLWRRSYPLAAVAVAYGAPAIGSALILLGAEPSIVLYATVYVILMPYSLFRWGSGREAAVGLGVIVASQVVIESASFTGAGDAVVGVAFYAVPAALGTAVRYRAHSRVAEFDRARMVERERLARELHDSVAHHVTAIALQAEAGLAQADAGKPAGAVEALEAISAASSRTLTDMRSIVCALRATGSPETEIDVDDLVPQPTIADLDSLVAQTGARLEMQLTLTDNLDQLPLAIQQAVFRLAQESVTNALRHARHATRLDITVAGTRAGVRLVVTDDGSPSGRSAAGQGFGLVGMNERVSVLGGNFVAGFGTAEGARGWTVTADLPTVGAAS